MEQAHRVLVGVGILILNREGKVLIGKRKGFVPKHSIPGGGLGCGETFEEGAMREALEETSLIIKNPKVIGITNNLETYKETGKHYVSVVMLVTEFEGEPCVTEPEKCESWDWCDPKNLPMPHFDASRMAIDRYLSQEFYMPSEK